ncbi:MAG: DNA gyrase C-terminal beta-propeller domain-containing protein, partial [Chloroflexota bacterium]|nr:DNA gyrase C-terminal beta-propeller domain-containing protein [Chloroflexota bacterium]
KAMPLRHLANIHSNGLIAMDLESGDDLVAARLVDGYEDVVMVTRDGYGICFPVAQVPQRSRAAGGVHGIRLEPDDAVVTMDLAAKDNSLLVVTQNGYGKMTPLEKFRSQRRYGKGLRAIRVSEKTGPVADAQVVRQREGVELMLVSSRSQVTRTGLAEISVQGRLARGSRVWTGDDGDFLVALACFTENVRPVAQASAAASAPATNGSAEAAILPLGRTTDDDVPADDQSSVDSEQ